MEKQPWQPYEAAQPIQEKSPTAFPTGKRELLFAGMILLLGWALCNSFFYGGGNLCFALAVIGSLVCSFLYLLGCGYRPTFYSGALLLLSVVITAGFARTDDSFVKFVMAIFVLMSSNLSVCLMTGKNSYPPGTVSALLDAPRAAFRYGVGYLPEVFRGFSNAFRRSGTLGQKSGAFLLGLCIAIPLLAVMIPLLIRADAAFDGLMALLPEFDLTEGFITVVFGSGVACVLYMRGVALHNGKAAPQKSAAGKGISPITVNTVLSAVSILYGVYLVSQLAYLTGGFAMILPEEFTLAEYARRGFFEMALLSGGNLAVVVLGLGFVRKEKAAPLSTRLLCLFVGFVALFLIATASAKMFLYIDSFGLSRLRVLTQIIMLFLALTTLVIMVWLFVPKLAYMKVILLTAMVIGAATIWVDVDSQVAQYNVDMYLSGNFTHIDVTYLDSLGAGAVPQLARLAEEASDTYVTKRAKKYLDERRENMEETDIRQWNYVNHIAEKYLSANE